MTNLITIKEAAELLGVSTKTLRRWEQEGKIQATRTVGGHRRFNMNELLGSQNDTKLTICYGRVGDKQSQEYLAEQISLLKGYCTEQGWNYQIIQDVGGGIHGHNPGLIRLLKLICSQQVKRLVLTHKDRLLRLGADLIFTLCEIFGTEVVIINQLNDNMEEEELNQDLQEIITAFNARLYGSRNEKNHQLVDQLQEVAKKL
ncbi:MAG TPA: IS607 family transposase [Cyanothece sp. UBA12306]|nr:IS607 family transposase [Cyanothece sp. UBA12306]